MGNFHTEARFKASWKSPSLVAPSPINATAKSFDFLIFLPYETPHATGSIAAK